MCPELVEGHRPYSMILFCSRLLHCGAVLGGVKAKPCGWPAASLDPTCGRHRFEQRREQGGEWE